MGFGSEADKVATAEAQAVSTALTLFGDLRLSAKAKRMHKARKIAKPPPTRRGAKLKARWTLRNEKDRVAPSDNDDAPTRTDNKKKCRTK